MQNFSFWSVYQSHFPELPSPLEGGGENERGGGGGRHSHRLHSSPSVGGQFWGSRPNGRKEGKWRRRKSRLRRRKRKRKGRGGRGAEEPFKNAKQMLHPSSSSSFYPSLPSSHSLVNQVDTASTATSSFLPLPLSTSPNSDDDRHLLPSSSDCSFLTFSLFLPPPLPFFS